MTTVSSSANEILDSQNLPLTVIFTDAANNPTSTPSSGVPTWTSSDETIGSLIAASDGLSATFVTTGKLGTVTITVTVPDINLSGSLIIAVVAGPATSATIEPGAPTAR